MAGVKGASVQYYADTLMNLLINLYFNNISVPRNVSTFKAGSLRSLKKQRQGYRVDMASLKVSGSYTARPILSDGNIQ